MKWNSLDFNQNYQQEIYRGFIMIQSRWVKWKQFRKEQMGKCTILYTKRKGWGGRERCLSCVPPYLHTQTLPPLPPLSSFVLFVLCFCRRVCLCWDRTKREWIAVPPTGPDTLAHVASLFVLRELFRSSTTVPQRTCDSGAWMRCPCRTHQPTNKQCGRN